MNRPISSRRAFLAAALTSSATMLGCSPFTAVNALAARDTYRRSEGLAYGAHPRQRLDLYQPAETGGAAPVVIFFYGGNWNMGERANYLFAGEALASQGFVTVLPDYRLHPEVRFPDFLHDCAAAVRWTTENVSRFGGDPQQIFLMGHSAGAYNAAMLALDAQYLSAAGVERKRVRGLIGLAGPYDFLPLTGSVTRAVFGFPNTAPTTQPIYHVTADDPPALLITGSDDEVVQPGNSMRLGARMRASGVSARVIVYPGLGHARLVGALARPLRGSAPLLEDVASFIKLGPVPG